MKDAATQSNPNPAVVSLAQLLAEQPAAPPPGWIEPGLSVVGRSTFTSAFPRRCTKHSSTRLRRVGISIRAFADSSAIV